MNKRERNALGLPAGILVGIPIGWLTLIVIWFAAAPLRTENPQTFNLIVHSTEPPIPGVAQPHGSGFYSVTVWFVDHPNGVDVKGRINIGPGNGMFQDLGVLATFTDPQTAQQTFGTVKWDSAGVTIGSGPRTKTVSRSQYQSHR